MTQITTTLNYSDGYTLAYWIKTDAVANAGVYSLFQTATSGGETDFSFNNDGTVAHTIRGASSAPFNAPTSSDWHYYAITWDGTNHVIYVDGNLVNTTAGTLAIDDGALYVGGLYVGGIAPDTYRPSFNGTLDDLAIYKKPLSQSEVQREFQRRGGTVISNDFHDDISANDFSCAGNCAASSAVGAARLRAARFTGSQVYTSSTNIDFRRDFSISFWAAFANNTTSDNVLLSTRNDVVNPTGKEVMIAKLGTTAGADANKLQFGFVGDTTTTTAPIDDGLHYFVVTYDRNSTPAVRQIYIDGVLATSSNSGSVGVFNSAPAPLSLGWYNDTRYFNGLVDELTIYDHVLETADITSLYSGVPRTTTCCTAVYSDWTDTQIIDDPAITPLHREALVTLSKDKELINDDGDGVPEAGETILYRVDIENNGSTTARHLEFDDMPDSNTTLVTGSVSSNRGTVSNGKNSGDKTVHVEIGDVNSYDNEHDHIEHDDEDLDRSNDTHEEDHEDDEPHANNNHRDRALPAFARYVAMMQRDDDHNDHESDREHTAKREDEKNRDKERVVITFKATVNASTPSETDNIKNRAVVTGDNIPTTFSDDHDTHERDDDSDENTSRDPELHASKRGDVAADNDHDGKASAGDKMRYTVHVENRGHGNAEEVEYHDKLTNMENPSFDGENENRSDHDEVRVKIGELRPNTDTSFSYVVTVTNPLPSATKDIKNRGQLTCKKAIVCGETDDPTTSAPNDTTTQPSDNTPRITVSKQVSVQSTRNDGIVKPGDTLNYTVKINNTGNGVALASIYDDLPDSAATLVIGSVRTDHGVIALGNSLGDVQIRVKTGDIAPHESVTLSYQMQIPASIPSNIRLIRNQGTLRGQNFAALLSDDPTEPGQTDATTIYLTAQPAVSISKQASLFLDRDNDGVTSAGDQISYVINVKNSGNAAAKNLVINDALDPLLISDSASYTASIGVMQLTTTAATIATPIDRFALNDSGSTIANTGSSASATNVVGTFVGGVTSQTGLGSAVQFSGAGAFSTTNHYPDDFTIALWINTSDTSGTLPTAPSSSSASTGTWTTGIPLIDTTNGSGLNQFGVSMAAGRVSFGTSDATGVNATITSDTAIADGQWHHIAVTRSKTSGLQRIFIDGKLRATGIGATTSLNASSTVMVAGFATNSGSRHVGLLDEIQGFNSVILTSAITRLASIQPLTFNRASAANIQISTLPAGQTSEIRYTADITTTIPSGVRTLSNQAFLSGDNITAMPSDDPTTSPTNDATAITLANIPLLQSYKDVTVLYDADKDGTPSAGDTLQYRIRTINTGNATANNVVINDTPDPNTILVNGSIVSESGVVNSGNSDGDTAITIAAGNIPAGGSSTASYRTLIKNPLPSGLVTVQSQATSRADNAPITLSDDPTTMARSDTTSIWVRAKANIVMTAQVYVSSDNNSDTVASPGDILTYRITVTNNGTTTANALVMTDTLDTNVTLLTTSIVSDRGTNTSTVTGPAHRVVSTLGELPAGASATISFRTTIKNPLASGTTKISTQAVITGSNISTSISDDPSTVTSNDPTDIMVFAAPRLLAEKSNILDVDSNGNGMADIGDIVAYTVKISNIGNTVANNVTYHDVIDDITTIVPSSLQNPTGTIANTGTIIDATMLALPAQTEFTISYRVTVVGPLRAGKNFISNQGVVQADTLPPQVTNDPHTPEPDDTTRMSIVRQPLLQMAKQAALVRDLNGDGEAQAGDILEYVIRIHNNGNDTAQRVIINDMPDKATTLKKGSVRTSQGVVINGNETGDTTVTIAIGDILADASANLSYQVTIKNPLPSGVVFVCNQAIASASNAPQVMSDDPATSTETDPTCLTVAPGALLTTTKAVSLYADNDSDGTPTSGDILQYTFAIQNIGQLASQNAVLSDTLDVNTSFVSGSDRSSQGTWSNTITGAYNIMQLAIGTIPKNHTVTASYNVLITTPLPANALTIRNQAGVIGNNTPLSISDDPTTPKIGDQTEISLNNTPQLRALKQAFIDEDRDNNGRANAGDVISYIIEVHNDGNAVANNVTVNDILDGAVNLIIGSVNTDVGFVVTGNTNGDSAVYVDIGDIPAHTVATISYRVVIQSGLALRNVTVPTTSNPQIILANGAARVITNPSFEVFDNVLIPSWLYVLDSNMRGWNTTHPTKTMSGQGTGRIIEVQKAGVNAQSAMKNKAAADGTYYAELNAEKYSMIYQRVCLTQNESFDFSFFHHARVFNSTDSLELRLGIPTGLPSGSLPADDVSSRIKILQAVTGIDSTGNNATSSTTGYTHTTNISNTLVLNGWGRYSGTFTNPLPNGIRNLGFLSLKASTDSIGNYLDNISITLKPNIDLGTSRDTTAVAGNTATPLQIRINGRVGSATTIAIRKSAGTATSDTDFVLQTPVGPYTGASITHTPGSDVWLVTIPAGNYDGGIVANNNKGGISIPVAFVANNTTEISEWAQFTLQLPNIDGASNNWNYADPTCDGSFKTDVVYRIDPPAADPSMIINQAIIASSNHTDILSDDPQTDPIPDVTKYDLTNRIVLNASNVATIATDVNHNRIPDPGDSLGYTVTIKNTSNVAATNVVFNDTPDVNAPLIATSVTTTLGSVRVGNTLGDTKVQVLVGTIPAGRSMTIRFNARIANPLPIGANDIQNQGVVSGTAFTTLLTDDPTTPLSDDPTITHVVATPELSVSKFATLATDNNTNGIINANDVVLYRATIRNTGNINATGVIYTDAPDINTAIDGPIQTNYGTVTSGNTYGDRTIIVTLGTIQPNSQVDIVYYTRVNPTLPAEYTVIRNQGVLTSNELATVVSDDPTTLPPNDSTEKSVVASAKLTATQSVRLVTDNDANGVASAGDTLLYTLLMRNSGEIPAETVALTNTLDTALTLITTSLNSTIGTLTSNTNGNAHNFNATFGTIGPKAEARISYLATIRSPLQSSIAVIQHQAIITSNNAPTAFSDDPDTLAVDDPTSITVQNKPELAVTQRVILTGDANSDGIAEPGDTLTYQTTISNHGASTAQAIEYIDVLDEAVTYTNASLQADDGTPVMAPTGSTSTFTWNLTELPANHHTTASYVVTIKSSLPSGTTLIRSQGQATATGLAPTLSDDPTTIATMDATDVYVESKPYLRLTQSYALVYDQNSDGYIQEGDVVEYEIQLVNTGTVAADDVHIVDVPALSTKLFAGSVKTSRGNVLVGNRNGDATIDIAIDTVPVHGVVIASYRVTVPIGKVTLSTSSQANSVNTPAYIQHTNFLTRANIPTVISIINNQATAQATGVPSVVSDNPTTIALNDPTQFSLVAAPLLTVTKQSQLISDADASGAPSSGDVLRYIITIINDGQITATNTGITDTLDTNTTLVPSSTSITLGSTTLVAGPPTTIVGTIGTLAPNAIAELVYDVTVNPALASNVTAITNQAIAHADNVPVILSDDPQTTTPGDATEVIISPNALIQVEKTVTLNVDADKNGYASAGDTIAYRVVIHNAGNGTATSVRADDTLDSNTSLVVGSVATSMGSITTGNTLNDTRVALTIGTMGANAIATISFNATINASIPSNITTVSNQMAVYSANYPDVLSDDPFAPGTGNPTVLAVTNQPILRASKVVLLYDDVNNNGVGDAGDTLIYRVDISNVGNASAKNVVFADTPDINTTLVINSVSASRGIITKGNTTGDQMVSVTLGTLAAGDTAMMTYIVTINPALPTSITHIINQAAVSADNAATTMSDDPTTTIPNDATKFALTTLPFLTSVKSVQLSRDADGNGILSPGDELSYIVTINNTGGATAQSVLITDTIDADTTFVSSSALASSGSVATSGSKLTGNVGDILPGSHAIVSYRVTINPSISSTKTTIRNQAQISAQNHAVIHSANTLNPNVPDFTSIAYAAHADFIYTLRTTLTVDSDNNGIASAGDTLNYSVQIINTGNIAATNAVMTITPDPNTTLLMGSVVCTSGTVTSGNAVNQPTVAVALGNVPAQATAIINYKVLIKSTISTRAMYLSSQGALVADNVTLMASDDPATLPTGDATQTILGYDPYLEAYNDGYLYTDADNNGYTSPGDTLRFDISIYNRGIIDATNVVITEDLELQTSLVAGSILSSQGIVTETTSSSSIPIFIVNLGTIPAQTGVVRISHLAVVDAGYIAPDCNCVSHQSDISYQSAGTPRAQGARRTQPKYTGQQRLARATQTYAIKSDDPANTTSSDPTVQSVGTLPYLNATKSQSIATDVNGNGIIDPGDTLQYQIVASNTGTGIITSVVINDTPDSKTTIVPGSASTTQGSITTGNSVGDTTIVATIGNIAIGTTVTVLYQVVVKTGATGTISNQATITTTTPSLPSTPSDNPKTTTANDPTQSVVGSRPTAITLEMLRASKVFRGVAVTWRTGREQDTWKYQVYRINSNGSKTLIPACGNIMARGTYYSGASYTCTDLSGTKSSRYRLQEITYGGVGSTFDVRVNASTFNVPSSSRTGDIPPVFLP